MDTVDILREFLRKIIQRLVLATQDMYDEASIQLLNLNVTSSRINPEEKPEKNTLFIEK